MQDGNIITCPRCSAEIDDFSLAGEWFCDCGECGIFDDEDEEVDEDDGK